ncbi:hypothetical protein BJP77_19270 [Mycobacterium avium subsp. hominissuis]|uniref:hypothetical protein n=1 Tax=Mycobacterium avium TaxID=1764 RepID=UPI00313BB0F3
MATTEPHADTRPLLHHSTGRDQWIEGRRYLGLDVLTRARAVPTSTDEAADDKAATTQALTA